MPIVDLPFCSKPIGQITPVFTTSMLPKLVGSMGDLFFQADVFIHVKYWCANFVRSLVFHIVNPHQNAKQSQPKPKNPA